MIRSLLFLPGNTPNILVNAAALGADAVIFDLEDAVSPGEKDAARILVRNALQELDLGGCRRIVRINGLDTPYWQEDLEEVIPCLPDLIMPAKISSPQEIEDLEAYLTKREEELCRTKKEAVKVPGKIGLLPLIETALGVENAFAIAAASPRVQGLFLGAEDLTADLGCRRTKEGREILYARGRLVTAARAAGLEVYDTPFTDVNDDQGLALDAAFAKSLGFSGKAAISPRHIPAINRIFSPAPEEIDYAYQVLEAIRQGEARGKGAVALQGKMIDAPIAARARRTVAAAEQLGLGRGRADE